MVSAEALTAAFKLMRTAGCAAPAAWAKRPEEEVITVWRSLLPEDFTDAEASAAAARWTQRPSNGFNAPFPTPGQLVSMVRQAPTDGDLGLAGRDVWRLVLDLQRTHREHVGQAVRKWKSDRHEADAAARIGPAGMMALHAIGGYPRIELTLIENSEGRRDQDPLGMLEGIFVADFRTAAKRAANGESLTLPTITARPMRSITQDAEMDMHPDVSGAVLRVLRGEPVDREALRNIRRDDLAADNMPLRRI